MQQVQQAHAQGFAPTMVVEEFESHTAYALGEGFTGIPCPNQKPTAEGERAKTCVECRMCWNDTKLHANKQVVLFSLHGLVAKHFTRKLTTKKRPVKKDMAAVYGLVG
jgi:hypothetical protein